MRALAFLVLCTGLFLPALAQDDVDAPSDAKARKTYQQALQDLEHNQVLAAFDNFKRADKQSGGQCLGCQKKIIKYGVELRDWKAAESAVAELIANAHNDQETALAHYEAGIVLRSKGEDKHKDEIFAQAHEEMAKAIAAYPNFPSAYFADGQLLARLKQDAEAKKRFEDFVKMRPASDPLRQRALRFISDPELARARMAPAFAVTTTDGQRVSLDELQGKVVLIDFWATWCGPCREALPHMKEIVKKFQGQPLVVLSISLDDDEKKWKDFVAKNEMTWPQYRDGGSHGEIARMFGVQAIPQTFTIDSDGILQDQRIGDASIEGKLKKIVSRAPQSQSSAPAK
jgi:thiol-disulfide isomerase/thioredoxin